MSRWIVALVTLLLVVSGLYAQEDPPFQAALAFAPYWGDLPLYTTCDGTTPIEDGRLIKIFQDVDNDGPDDTDPMAPLCNDPPQCESGIPTYSHNYNQFTMNGVAIMGEAGYFWTDLDFRSMGYLPLNPYYYLRIYEPDGTTVLWTSTVKTLASGPQTARWNRGNWTCGAGGPQCVVRDEQE